MRPDALAPRTGVLAVVAGWAVLVYGLVLFGVGGRVAPLPDDPAQADRLPQLPAPAADRVGPLPQYAVIGERPLFSRNRQPQPFFIAGQQEGAPQGFDYVLSSVLDTPALKLAILQPAQGGEGVRVRLGEAPQGQPGWRLVELLPRSAVFEGPEGRRTLELRVFDGSGGAPPTPVAAPSPGAQAPPVSAPRITGGPAPAASAPAAATAAPPPAEPAAPQAPTATVEPQSTEAQMEEIRRRIEARREQRRRQEQNPTPPAPPGQTQ